MAVADGGRAAARGDRLVKLIRSAHTAHSVLLWLKSSWGSARSQCSKTHSALSISLSRPFIWHQIAPLYCLYDYCYHMKSAVAAT